MLQLCITTGVMVTIDIMAVQLSQAETPEKQKLSSVILLNSKSCAIQKLVSAENVKVMI